MFGKNVPTPEEFATEMGIPDDKREAFIKQATRMEIAVTMEAEFPTIADQIDKRYSEFKSNHPEATDDEVDTFMQSLLDDAKALVDNPFFAPLLANEARDYAEWVKENYLMMSAESAKDISIRMLKDRTARNRARRMSAVFSAMGQIEYHLDNLSKQN